MDRNSKKQNYYELLLLNQENALRSFILREGKQKSVCPIQFDTQQIDNDRAN